MMLSRGVFSPLRYVQLKVNPNPYSSAIKRFIVHSCGALEDSQQMQKLRMSYVHHCVPRWCIRNPVDRAIRIGHTMSLFGYLEMPLLKSNAITHFKE